MAEIEQGITRLDGKLDLVVERVEGGRRTHEDHEVRIRSLENTSSIFMAAANASKSTWVYIVATAMGVPSLITAIIAILQYIQK